MSVVPSNSWQPSSECNSFYMIQAKEKPPSSENQITQVPGTHLGLSEKNPNKKTEDYLQLLPDREILRTQQKHLSFSSRLSMCISKSTQTRGSSAGSPDPIWGLLPLGILDVSTMPEACALSSRLGCRAATAISDQSHWEEVVDRPWKQNWHPSSRTQGEWQLNHPKKVRVWLSGTSELIRSWPSNSL